MLIGKEYQLFSSFRIFEADTPNVCRILPMTVEAIENDALIADYSCGAICWGRIKTASIEVRFGTCHKETAGLMQCVKTGEVRVCPIHYVESSRLWDKQIQNIHVVQFSIGDMHEAWNSSSEVQ